jgi:isoleucyl-tRNA synthetase
VVPRDKRPFLGRFFNFRRYKMGKNFKDTLLIPKTDFPMRGNLGKKEPVMQESWRENDLYNKVLEKNKDRSQFVLHDGPPYANGSIHAGHALNKILKDFIIRYKNMSGFRAPYLPGWDTHGLPIENALSKNKKVNRKKMDLADFRILCRAYALEQVDIQREQFKRLGVLGEWDHPYITLNEAFEAAQYRVFNQMVKKGLIYKGLKPVYWSPSSETALAEAEIEYKDVISPSIYFTMEVKDSLDKLPKNTFLVVWTTTPWTVPANLAVAVGPNIEYTLVKVDGKHYVVGKERLEALKDILNWENVSQVQNIFGWELEHMIYKHPI